MLWIGSLILLLLAAYGDSLEAGEKFRRDAYFAWPAELYPSGDYDPAVPTFAGTLGFQPGQWIPSADQTHAYLDVLAASSPRVSLSTTGRTHEGRPLLLAVISSEANLARLDTIRENLRRLSSEHQLDDEQFEAILSNTPTVVWLAYSVHGNEHSGTDAALMTAYHLAADRSAATRAWLDSVVVLLDPMQNPDGRQRFLRWQESTVARNATGAYRPDPDPMAAEHREPWPSGRFNHYLFDLNRDWFLLTQAESRARVQVLLDWSPQVVVDLHEMGTNQTYFFPPPAAPINPHIPPSLRRWWEVFGKGNAQALDAVGADYYTAETFDSFYPGYGDSLPTLLGALGMTYEQASARGLAQQRRDGSVLTLREALWHHFLTSLATVNTAAAHRRDLLRDYRLFFRDGHAATGEIWIQPPEGGSTRELADHLSRLGVRILFPQGELSNPRLQPLTGDGPAPPSLSPDGFLIPLAQPHYRLIRTLFDVDIPLDQAFLQEEEARRHRREPDSFYDLTSWNMALAYGVEAFESDRPSSGEVTAQAPEPRAGVRGDGNALAYLMRYSSNEAAAALVDLLSHEPALRVQIARKEFRIGEERYAPGTVVVKTSGSPPDLPAVLGEAALRHGVTFQGVDTGLTDEGIDLGSRHVASARLPRIALFWGAPASPSSAGWMAYLMEQRFGLDFTRLNPEDVRAGDLAGYDVILFPATGSGADPLGEEYVSTLGEQGQSRLRTWVESGGTYVGFGGGAAWLALPDVAWTSAGLALQPDDDEQADDPAAEGGNGWTADDLPKSTPGAMARVRLDTHHLLSAGYSRQAVVPVLTRLAFLPGKGGRSVAVFEEEDRLQVSGFMWEDTRQALAGGTYLLQENLGRGQLILFAGEPAFRGYWPALHRLFLNTILVSPTLRD
jgi:hypothetical protein